MSHGSTGFDPLTLIGPPYDRLTSADALHGEGRTMGGGWFLIWNMGVDGWERAFDSVGRRPGGLALVIVLPETARVQSVTQVLRAIERSRPQVVLPYHERLDPREIATVLRRPPPSLSACVSEYLAWRGLTIDAVTARIVRRTVDLSEQVRTITALARNLYVSRRALGRRFLTRSLPVPSHWLHMARLLRATVRLQSTQHSLFHIACELGYPDGFSLSNQMSRLCGVRPSEARQRLGWEWLIEAWLVQEAGSGGLHPGALKRRPSLFSAEEAADAVEKRASTPVAISL